MYIPCVHNFTAGVQWSSDCNYTNDRMILEYNSNYSMKKDQKSLYIERETSIKHPERVLLRDLQIRTDSNNHDQAKLGVPSNIMTKRWELGTDR